MLLQSKKYFQYLYEETTNGMMNIDLGKHRITKKYIYISYVHKMVVLDIHWPMLYKKTCEDDFKLLIETKVREMYVRNE
jgi:hypothetical protein